MNKCFTDVLQIKCYRHGRDWGWSHVVEFIESLDNDFDIMYNLITQIILKGSYFNAKYREPQYLTGTDRVIGRTEGAVALSHFMKKKWKWMRHRGFVTNMILLTKSHGHRHNILLADPLQSLYSRTYLDQIWWRPTRNHLLTLPHRANYTILE